MPRQPAPPLRRSPPPRPTLDLSPLLDLRTGSPGGKMPGLVEAVFAQSIKCFGDSRMSTQRFASFHDFYPYYLREHSSRASRRLHVIGTALAIVLLIAALVTRTWNLLWAVPLCG